MNYLYFFIGVLLLSFGADRFVTGAEVIARRLGVSKLIIGMVLVGFATSMPEMLVAGSASLRGSSELAVGNVIGSNIANIGLVLGVAGLIRPLVFPGSLLHHEFPILLIVTLLVTLMLVDGFLSRFDGCLLLMLFVAIIAWMVFRVKNVLSPKVRQEMSEAVEIPKLSLQKAMIWWSIGLVVLLVGAYITVESAVVIARMWGVTELVIGLTLVAVGTSLPELATAIVSALRGESELVMGNIIGSNLFNTLPVLMMPALISPSHLPRIVLTRDVSSLVIITFLLGALSWTAKPHVRLGGIKAAILLLSFVGYITLVYFYHYH